MLDSIKINVKSKNDNKKISDLCNLANKRKWTLVFEKLTDNSTLNNTQNDSNPDNEWALMDYAAHQQKWWVIATLIDIYKIEKRLHPDVVIFHLKKNNWAWLWKLIKENILQLDAHYYFDDHQQTLYDLAKKYASKNIFNLINIHYIKHKPIDPCILELSDFTQSQQTVCESKLEIKEEQSNLNEMLCNLTLDESLPCFNLIPEWLPSYQHEKAERGVSLLNPKEDEKLTGEDLSKNRSVFGPISRPFILNK